MSKKIEIDGEKHFCKSIKKYLNALLSICATLPDDEGYKRVNVKNNALFLALDITFYGERGYRTFLLEKGLVTRSKEGSFNTLSNKRTSDLYTVNWYNICNFLISFTRCTGKYLNVPAIKSLYLTNGLSEDLREFFWRYYEEGPLLEEFENSKHYKMYLVNEMGDENRNKDYFPTKQETRLIEELQ